MKRIERGFIVTILLITVIASAFGVVGYTWACAPPPPCQPGTVRYVGRDYVTKGSWIEQGYGECGYALPYTCLKYTEVATGMTTGIGCSGYKYSNSYWWREPWSALGSIYYPYSDYLGGKKIIQYKVTGPEGAPRALVDADSTYYRPAWYCNDSSITVTLKGIVGNFNVSTYFLDWDAPGGGAQRQLSVKVTSGGYWDTATLGTTFPENFAAGTYAIFEVNSGGIITVEITNIGPKEHSAVLSGIFLDSISDPVTGVEFLGLDHETKGNWRSAYGSDYYLLPGFKVPSNNVAYGPINKSYDVTNLASVNYVVSKGTCQFAADYARTYGAYPFIGQYSAYTWTDNSTAAASDTRLLMYPRDRIYNGYPPTPLSRRFFGAWDSGELGEPLNYFVMTVKIPDGNYLFSVYAVDFERVGRSETIEVWNSGMTALLDSQHISDTEINGGIYVQWAICGSTTINIKVIADAGNLNCFINGIFLNCVSCNQEKPPCG